MGRIFLMAIAISGLGACGAEPAADGKADGSLEASAPGDQAPSATNGTANAVAVGSDRQSQFTSIDPDKCKLLEENVEEGGWWRRLCQGQAGYKLELSDSDLRQDIVIIPPKGPRSDLGLSEIVAKGAFNSLGTTAEWRGRDPGEPDALIVRLNVASDPEAKRPDISNLVVVRLKAPACVVAVVPPKPGQNEVARSVADGALPPCLKR